MKTISFSFQGKPESVKFLDYQMAAIGHPVIDLCYYLYIMTDGAFRAQHLETCLRWYYDAYSKYFVGIMDDYTYDDFRKEFEYAGEGATLLGLCVRS